MNFNGSDHYFFWVGIQNGQEYKGDLLQLEYDLENLVALPNLQTEKTKEAYKQGYFLGMQLTEEEVEDLLDGE